MKYIGSKKVRQWEVGTIGKSTVIGACGVSEAKV